MLPAGSSGSMRVLIGRQQMHQLALGLGDGLAMLELGDDSEAEHRAVDELPGKDSVPRREVQ
jgi:hypothetical protein